ncbi:MAG: N-acetylglucosamine-6-phosphate deacetylase [Firmicutes bacterium]|nr:N-acetylglucosamine-6-phosphate deacetylase [Bacillota bacterium]
MRWRNGQVVLQDRVAEGWEVAFDPDQGILSYVGPDRGPGIMASSGTLEPEEDLAGAYVSPGFIDVHVHGGGGADFMDATVEACTRVCEEHARHGTTSLLATTLTASPESLQAAVEAAVQARQAAGPRPSGARILGLHLEGPYLSPAHAGAQDPAFLRAPDREELERLQRLARGAIRMVTLAPELAGAAGVIQWCREQNVVAVAGHTDATYDQAMQAFVSGVRMCTHTFNAMRGLHHREPGTVGAVLDSPTVVAQLIADGIHVHPAAVRLLWRIKGPDGLALITDAMRAEGLRPGTYDLGGLTVQVDGRSARLADGTLAGSLLTMEQAVAHVRVFTGAALAQAVRAATWVPARVLGLADRYGSLEAGKMADLVVLSSAWQVQQTVVGGHRVYRRESL